MPFDIETNSTTEASWNRERTSDELQSFISSRIGQFDDLEIEV